MQVFAGEFDICLKDFFLGECHKHQLSNLMLQRQDLIPKFLEDYQGQGGVLDSEEESIAFMHKYKDGASHLYDQILDDYLCDNYHNIENGTVKVVEKMKFPSENPFYDPVNYAYWMIAIGLEALLEKYGFFEQTEDIQLNVSFIHEWEAILYEKEKESD